ncbi:hypothetical protein [Limobrevibacterium gyesilva]|uniref:Lipoprotein n=1 Tax=Limobrevibacterium gyesilva TaxID=2991712 RepID=A0AA41YRR4_9PROT|nr:hypothetical protein [Limobrevibacterium gyesilva]MCW3477491.1 hypothetical protein [Limobrevibacterium gyesilva]
MKHLAALILPVLLLGACSTGPAPSTAQAECEQEAQRDPDLQTLRDRYAFASPYFANQVNGELKEAIRQSVQKCMRARGLAPPGGVEAVKK